MSKWDQNYEINNFEAIYIFQSSKWNQFGLVIMYFVCFDPMLIFVGEYMVKVHSYLSCRWIILEPAPILTPKYDDDIDAYIYTYFQISQMSHNWLIIVDLVIFTNFMTNFELLFYILWYPKVPTVQLWLVMYPLSIILSTYADNVYVYVIRPLEKQICHHKCHFMYFDLLFRKYLYFLYLFVSTTSTANVHI